MKDLFLCEWRRFRNPALIFAAVHLAILVFLMRLDDVIQLGWRNHLMVLAAYLAAGLVFAMAQFGSYRQPSRWLWLMHRPLERRAIFAATSLASLALAALAIGLPLLLAIGFTDRATARTVDMRHYLLAVHAVLLTMCAWLAGSYVVLSGRRTAIVILVLPLLAAVNLASAWVLLAPAVACVALLAWIVYSAFKPDRRQAPRGLALLAIAVPLQIGLYLALVWAFAIAWQGTGMMLGTHPLNLPVPPAGGFIEASRADGRALFAQGLAGATDPRAAQWRRQIALLDIANFEPSGDQHAVRGSASNMESTRFTDSGRHIEWTFSHDAMLFHGADTHTGQDRGWMGARGVGDTTPFPAVPVLPGGPLLMTAQALYGINVEQGTIQTLIALSGTESLAREPKRVGELLYVITNERLIAYVRPSEETFTGPYTERFSVRLPERFSNLDRIDTATLLDGTLISFTFGRQMSMGGGDSSQTIMLIDGAGQARLVAQRRLAHDFPVLFEHHDWWMSPLLHTVLAMPDLLLDRGMILDKGHARYSNKIDTIRPPAAWMIALAAAILSSAGAAWWLRGAPVGVLRKYAWIAGCMLIGPPSLVSLMVLQPRRRLHAPGLPSTAPPLAA